MMALQNKRERERIKALEEQEREHREYEKLSFRPSISPGSVKLAMD